MANLTVQIACNIPQWNGGVKQKSQYTGSLWITHHKIWACFFEMRYILVEGQGYAIDHHYERNCALQVRSDALLFQELGVPIGDVDGVEIGHPFPVSGHAESLLHEWGPLWFERFSHQRHVRLLWSSSAFAPVAFVT